MSQQPQLDNGLWDHEFPMAMVCTGILSLIVTVANPGPLIGLPIAAMFAVFLQRLTQRVHLNWAELFQFVSMIAASVTFLATIAGMNGTIVHQSALVALMTTVLYGRVSNNSSSAGTVSHGQLKTELTKAKAEAKVARVQMKAWRAYAVALNPPDDPVVQILSWGDQVEGTWLQPLVHAAIMQFPSEG